MSILRQIVPLVFLLVIDKALGDKHADAAVPVCADIIQDCEPWRVNRVRVW
ncbi:MAG: hypothetical protein GWP67_01905 [Gammaproteobacteria bacterium]|nr:hypothetical protein [Gammaproteobacteria bacterium]